MFSFEDQLSHSPNLASFSDSVSQLPVVVSALVTVELFCEGCLRVAALSFACGNIFLPALLM